MNQRRNEGGCRTVPSKTARTISRTRKNSLPPTSPPRPAEFSNAVNLAPFNGNPENATDFSGCIRRK